MVFQPDIKQELIISGVVCHIAEHPFAPGMPYGQEGRTAVVYELLDPDGGKRAFKVFKPRYRVPALVSLSRRLAPFAELPGLRVCKRNLLTPQHDSDVLSEHPDLIYAVVMPWIEGPSWMEVLLNKQEISQEESLTIARAFAAVLVSMEQEGLAHCDLSGPNLLLPVLADDGRQTTDDGRKTTEVNGQSPVELVDVEQMYGPDMRKPDFLPSGSSGYAHNTSHEGMWSPDADRFAGALLLAEILAWCDQRTHNMAWGESYFDPEEMQKESERYHVLITVLRDRWGEGIARLFEHTWRSGTSVECPTFGDWMMRLPLTVPPQGAANSYSSGPLATEATTPASNGGGNTSWAQTTVNIAPPVPAPLEQTGPPVATTTTSAPAVSASTVDPAQLFDDGLAAFRRGDWASASELLAAVIYQDPGYAKDGVNAAQLLVEADGHLAHSPAQPRQSAPPVPTMPHVPQVPQTIQEQATPAYVTPNDYQQDIYVPLPDSRTVVAPQRNRAIILIPALIVLALLVVGGIVWFLAQNASRDQEIAAAATATAVTERDAAATAAVDDATTTAVVAEQATAAVIAQVTVDAQNTATTKSYEETQVAVYAQQTSETLAAIATSTGQANADITSQAQVVATKEALVLQTSVAAVATAHAIPPSGEAISVSNRDRLTTLRTLQGHTDKVGGIAFSLDGQFLASASQDHTARVWRVADGSLVQTMKREGDVYDVDFSPDGKTLALATDTGTEIWNVADGLLLRAFPNGISYTLAFSADGLTVLAGLQDGTVAVWRVADGTPLFMLTGHTDYITSVAFSPDQKMIAAGANDNTIRLWKTSDGTPINTLIGSNRIQGLAFSPDGQVIVASLGDDSVKEWRISDAALLNTIPNSPALGMAFSPDGQLIAIAGAWTKVIHLGRVSDGADVGTLEGHTAAVNSVAFSPDGSLLASSADDNTIRLWGIGPKK